MPLSALKFHFLQITFFSAVITRTHHLPTHTPFFRPIMSKKRALHLFLKITFFCSVLLLLTPETYPNHLFRKTNDQKWSKNLPKGGNFFFLFVIIYFTFSLSPYGNKQNHLLFPPFLSSVIEKPQGKTSHKNFFFLLFSILPLSVIGKITTYLFFRNSDLKCPKMPLSALKFHFLQITFFSAVITRTHTPFHTHSVFPTHNV